MTIAACAVAFVCIGFTGNLAAAKGLDEAIQTLRAVGPEGRGNDDASHAWKVAASGGLDTLPQLLKAMDGANVLALNWLRAAVDTIVAREKAAGQTMPVAMLETFIHDTEHHPRARRLAYELIAGENERLAQRLLQEMHDDPSTELRRDAVQTTIDHAARLKGQGNSENAVTTYLTALKSARDIDQIEAIAEALRDLKRPVDLPSVFGWISRWKVVGPFDSTGGQGFDKQYTPEHAVDLTATYPGKLERIRWQEHQAKGDYGKVDLNVPFGSLKGVAAYAYTELHSEKPMPVELRLGCKNAWKVWLNGQLLFGRDEYHRGTEIDQYRIPAKLRHGSNSLLLKICQNEQQEEWTKEWEFQLRVTDPLGTPIFNTSPKSDSPPQTTP